MKDIELFIKKHRANEFVAVVLYSWKYYKFKRENLFLDIEICSKSEKQVLKRQMFFSKIIEPEIYKYLKDDYIEKIANIPITADIIKFGIPEKVLQNVINIHMVCKTDTGKVVKERVYDDLLLQHLLDDFDYWKELRNEKFVLHTNILMENLKVNLNGIIDAVCDFCNLKIYNPIQYYIADSILDIYSISGNFPVLETNCLTVEDKVIIFLYSNKYSENIIVHETVHALLYQNYFRNKKLFSRWQNLCLEGYCQFVMNCLCHKSDMNIRFNNAIQMLNITNINELEELIFSDLKTSWDVIIGYELLPYIFEKWSSDSDINSDLLCNLNNDKIIKKKLDEHYRDAVKCGNDKWVFNLNEEYYSLYTDFFNDVQLVDGIEQYNECVRHFRYRTETLRYFDNF